MTKGYDVLGQLSAIGHNTVCCLPMLLLFYYLFYYLCYTIVSCLGKMCKEQTEP